MRDSVFAMAMPTPDNFVTNCTCQCGRRHSGASRKPVEKPNDWSPPANNTMTLNRQDTDWLPHEIDWQAEAAKNGNKKPEQNQTLTNNRSASVWPDNEIDWKAEAAKADQRR